MSDIPQIQMFEPPEPDVWQKIAGYIRVAAAWLGGLLFGVALVLWLLLGSGKFELRVVKQLPPAPENSCGSCKKGK